MPLAGEIIKASDIGDITEDTSDAGITLSTSFQTALSVVLGVGVWEVSAKVRFTGSTAADQEYLAELHDGTTQLDEARQHIPGVSAARRCTIGCLAAVTVTSGTTTVNFRLSVGAVSGTQTYAMPKLIAHRAPE